jgi:hypothetical protein
MSAWRIPIAFLVAPLAVPALMVWVLEPPGGDPGMTLLIVGGTAVTYIFSVLLGIPIFLFLYKRRLTDLWIALVAGAVAAVIVWYLIAASFALSFAPWSYLPSRLAEPGVTKIALFFMLAGAAVGAIFWLIARPDRQT